MRKRHARREDWKPRCRRGSLRCGRGAGSSEPRGSDIMSGYFPSPGITVEDFFTRFVPERFADEGIAKRVGYRDP